MDPFLLLLAGAVASGVGSVATKLIKKGVVEPLLEPATEQIKAFVGSSAQAQKKQERIAKAILAAIEDSAEVEGEADGVRYAREIGLARLTLPENTTLRDDIMGLVYLASNPNDASFITSALLADLHLQPTQRLPLARFLHALRDHLYELDEFRPVLDLRHQENVENALRLMITYLAPLADTTGIVNGKRVIRTSEVAPVWNPRAYLEALTQEFSRMRLSVIDARLLKAGEQPLTLDLIYTDLDVEQMIPLTTEEKKKPELEFRFEERDQRRMTAIEAVSGKDARHLVLLGYPGSGKSTFVNFLALCLVKERLERGSPEGITRLAGWTHGALLPVRVVLRELIAWVDAMEVTEASPQVVWDYIAHTTNLLGYEEEFKSLKKYLQDEGGILLLDGLDEVREADARRLFIKQMVESFARANPRLRILVTCRPYAYQRDDWQLDGFNTHSLALFNRKQTQRFIRVWYQVIGPREGWDSPRIAEKTNALVAATVMPHLQDLSSRPLLLTLMATLHATGQLPEDRADLYARSVKLLLDTWQTEKGGGLAAFGLDAETVERIMGQVGLAAHARQGKTRETRQSGAVADISREELREAFKRELKSGDRAEEVVEYIQTRAGLLTAEGQRNYTFPHRSFQEFAAACAAVESDDFPDDLVTLVQEDADWWREVYLLAAGRTRSPRLSVAVDLIDTLCGEGPTHPRDEGLAAAALLAARAASEIRLASRAADTPRFGRTLRRLQEWLVAIIQHEYLSLHERAEAGRVLSALGEIRPDVSCELPETVPVDAGEFSMGSEDYDDEKPLHQVRLNAYRIGKFPVTNAQFRRFVEDDGYTEKWDKCWSDEGRKWRTENELKQPQYWNDPDENVSNHPVNGVSWYEAVAYCNWLTENDTQGRIYRLPTEAEWEKAARGTDGREYPWEGAFDSSKANTNESEIGRTTAVGLFPRGVSPYGALDMSGNVWEWCADWYEQEYYKDSPLENPQGPASGDSRVLRGGSFGVYPGNARCADRDRYLPVIRYSNIGFRVAQSVLP